MLHLPATMSSTARVPLIISKSPTSVVIALIGAEGRSPGDPPQQRPVIERYPRRIGALRSAAHLRRSRERIEHAPARGRVSHMRLVALNTLTVGATMLLLALLALPAKRTLDRGAQAEAAAAAASAPLARYEPAADPRRVFGAYVDPWHVDEWSRAIGAAPQAIAKFESFSRDRTLDSWYPEIHRQGISRMLVSWEPWKPVPAALGLDAQARAQDGYRNIDIARGAQDRYIMRFARSLARFPGTVWLRYAHEMNGYWYPWSRDARAYRWAWRRIVRVFGVAGADNVRFVWSVNANLYEPADVWLRGLRRRWLWR